MKKLEMKLKKPLIRSQRRDLRRKEGKRVKHGSRVNKVGCSRKKPQGRFPEPQVRKTHSAAGAAPRTRRGGSTDSTPKGQGSYISPP